MNHSYFLLSRYDFQSEYFLNYIFIARNNKYIILFDVKI